MTVRISKPTIPLPETIIIPDDNRILYYRRDRELFRFLSHFYAAAIVIDCETWPTVEHFYQSHKSSEPSYREAIRNAPSAANAKQLAAFPDAPK